MSEWIIELLQRFSLPEFGLITVCAASFVAGSLIPFTSTPLLLGLIKLNPALFWPAVMLATLADTFGGAVSWFIGRGANHFYQKLQRVKNYGQILALIRRFGAKACFFTWIPGIGLPMSAIVGWMRLPFKQCFMYTLLGKFTRYLLVALVFIWIWPGALEL